MSPHTCCLILLLFQDTHTLDLSEFESGQTNITLLQIVDPEDINVKRVVNYWIDKEYYYNKRSLGVTAETVRVGIRQVSL
jgi:hypothetical protein